MKRFKILILFLFLSVFSGIYAQTSTLFPEDPGDFVKELDKALKATRSTETGEIADRFSDNFKDGKISESMAAAMIGPCNRMQERKMQVIPYIRDFVESVNNFAEKGLDESIYTTWVALVDTILAVSPRGKNTNYKNFIEFSTSYFASGLIYTSKSKSWGAYSNGFEFVMNPERPGIRFDELSLYGFTKGDTLKISKTSGTYFPFEQLWEGEKGHVNWARAGLDSNNVYCDFKSYSINVESNEYDVDSVLFSYKPVIDVQVLGKLTDKLVINNKEEKSSYPRFQSYNAELVDIPFVENIKYSGGFILNGSKVIGSGSEFTKAVMEFYTSDGELGVRARSNTFIIDQQEDIYSEQCEVVIYFSGDSISHPGIKLKYKIPENQLELYRSNEGIGSTTFYSSFHKMDIKVDAIFWKLDESDIQLRSVPGSVNQEAFFESANLFEPQKWRQMQGIMSYNPIAIMKKYTDDYNEREISSQDLAILFNPELNVGMIKGLLYELVKEGFIYYNEGNESVFIREKTINYSLANAEKIDFDIMKLKSVSPQKNGAINTQDKSLRLEGIFEIPVSDSQYVKVFPSEKMLIMEKNRDFECDGTVFAGKTDIYGNGFKFSYDDFDISMTKVDSMVIYVPKEKVPEGFEPKLVPVETSINRMTGTLKIDMPDNKSGKERFGHYPYFISKEPSYAFYDKRSIHNNAYFKEDFYFELEPFDFDSMNSFHPESLAFKGKLVSAGIFPDIQNEIVLRPDRSLGFVTETPASGLPVYGNKGTYYALIDLSNQGLRGMGYLDYLSSTTYSKDILFFPDSMNAHTDTIVVRKAMSPVQYPSVFNSDVFTHWEPGADNMNVRMKKRPFDFFDGIGTLKGEIDITPAGMGGKGMLDWDEALISSDIFRFGAMSINSDTAGLRIKSLDTTKVAFNLPNVRARVDFDKMMGNFKSNFEDIPTELPYNQYTTTMNEFDWDMKQKLISFKPPKDKEYSRFTSMHKKQDSLTFLAKGGTYNMENYLLNIEGIPEIRVADAFIIPENGLAIIEADAVMRTLENAVIRFDSLYNYHEIFNATVDIYGRKKYRGIGDYKYTTRTGQEQTIHFDDISTREEVVVEGDEKGRGRIVELQSYAKGIVSDSLDFYLDPKFLFKGPVELYAQKEFPEFKGYAKLNIEDTTKYRSSWFKIDDEINASQTVLTFDGAVSDRRDSIYAGLYKQSDSTNIYFNVLHKKMYKIDHEIFRATGVVLYDDSSNEFVFGNLDKIEGFNPKGNLFEFNDKTGEIYAEGAFDLGLDFDMIKMKAAGNLKHAQEDTAYTFKLTTALKLLLPDDLIKMLSTEIFEFNMDAEWVDYEQNEGFQAALPELMNQKDYETVMNNFFTTGEFTIPKDYPYNMVLTDLSMVWDEDIEAYRNVGGTAGIVFFGNQVISQQIKAYVEFGVRRSSDYLNLYFETEYDDWYLFNYRKNVLKVLSSNDLFNEAVFALEPDKRTFKNEEGGENLIFMLGSLSQRDTFKGRMEYYNEK